MTTKPPPTPYRNQRCEAPLCVSSTRSSRPAPLALAPGPPERGRQELTKHRLPQQGAWWGFLGEARSLVEQRCQQQASSRACRDRVSAREAPALRGRLLGRLSPASTFHAGNVRPLLSLAPVHVTPAKGCSVGRGP